MEVTDKENSFIDKIFSIKIKSLTNQKVLL